MNPKLFSLFFIIYSFTATQAQDFHGYVRKADSTSSLIFQAKIEITEGSKPTITLRTYFDGSFKFVPQKNQTYSIKVTYPGYTDTTYTFTTDKNAKPSEQNVIVRLKKDGMRLMGIIKSREEDFPIKEATIVLKNVMTRKEEHITTEIDGRYNFKLEYETNYKVWLDKRSPGIFNLYKDTSFYISTIGFNQPLDYKLDISLDPMPYPITSIREGYNASRRFINKNVKPETGVTNNDEKSQSAQKNIATSDSDNIAKKENMQLFKEKDERKTSDSVSFTPNARKGKPKRKEEKLAPTRNPDTTLISSSVSPSSGEKNQPLSELEMVRQKALAEKKAREIETQIAIKKAAEEKKRAEIIAQNEEVLRRQKMKNDSVAMVRKNNDSIMFASTQKQRTHADSISRLKELQQKKTIRDSTSLVKIFYLTKNQEVLINAAEIFAKRKKFVEDSIALQKEKELK